MDLPLTERFLDTACSQRNFAKSGIVAHHGDDDLTSLARLLDRRRQHGAAFHKLRCLIGAAVVNNEVVPGPENPVRHGLAHSAQTDKSHP